MAVNVSAATITNTVKYKTDISSLRKVIADIRRVQQAAHKATSSLAQSPKNSQQVIRQARQRATEIADAHIKAFNDVTKAKAAQNAKNTQSNWDHLFGMNLSGKSARQSSAAFMQDIKARGEAVRAEQKKEAEALKSSMNEHAAYREDARRSQIGNNRRNTQRSIIGVTEGNFNFSAGRLGADPAMLSAYQQRLKRLGDQYRQNNLDARNYTAASRRLLTELKDEARQAQITEYSFRDLKHELLGLGAAFGMEHFLHTIVDTGKQFQQLNSSMVTAFGPDAQNNLKFMSSLAQEMGININDLGKNYASFAFSAKTAGMTTQQVQAGFKAITTATTAFGLSQDKVNHVMMGFREIAGEGQIYKTQLNMISRQLPGFAELIAKVVDPKLFAKNSSAAMKEVREKLKSGALTAKEYLPAIFDEMQKMYGVNMQQNIHNLTNEQARLTNQWSYWKELAATSGVDDAMKRVYLISGELLEVTKPLAVFFGGMVKGVTDMAYYIGLGAAMLEDWLTDAGFIDAKTGSWDEKSKGLLNTMQGVGEAIGQVLAIYTGAKMIMAFGKVTGLIALYDRLKAAATGAGEAEAGAATATGGGVTGTMGKVFGLYAAVEISKALGDWVFGTLMPMFHKLMGWDDSKTSHGGNTVQGSWLDRGVNLIEGKGWNASPNLPTTKTTARTASGSFVPPSAGFNPYSRQEPQTVRVDLHVHDGAIPNLITAHSDSQISDMRNSGQAK